ncbi:DUF3857 domain-containing protein [Sphingomonas sp. RS2018]
MRKTAVLAVLMASTISSNAQAGDTPRYGPVPAWVVAAPPLDPAKLPADAPILLVFDNQQRLSDGTVSVYTETTMRIATPEVLGQSGTIALPWMPDKGDLTIHSAEILRGGETIDLLKGTTKFSVLQREQALEQRMMNGMLTATMAAEGLRIGDLLRVRLTVTQRDQALKGQMQTMAPVMAAPFRAGFARVRMSWPVADAVQVRSYFDGTAPVPRTENGFRVVELTMPVAKQPDLPGDLPMRFQRPMLIDAASFGGWSDVAKTMAPMYATDGLIAPGNALAGEVERIAKAETVPLRRAAKALQLVQDEVRYLLMGMNGGNYLPQSPAQTWSLRYGDCKAKSLMLLAMLRSLGIESEAVLASAQGMDLVSRRLPMPGAFDHVIVRALIDGKDYWLDGTSAGTRLEDIGDAPPFRFVLPLRTAGAELTPLPVHANARPNVTVTTDYDQRAGLSFPSVFRTTMRFRGPMAAMLNAGAAQASAQQKIDMIQGMVTESIGEAQLADSSFAYDPASGTATVEATGIVTTPWRRENKRMRWGVDKAVDAIGFAPDRSRPAWREMPVATGVPESISYRTTVSLPAKGKDFALEGDNALGATIAGVAVTRKASLQDGVVTLDERSDRTGVEIAPADVAAERQRLALAQSRALRIVAPAIVPPRWQDVKTAKAEGRFAPIEAVLAKAIAREPSEPTGYESRASFRAGIYDRRGAIADLTKRIELGNEGSFLLRRSGLYRDLGELDKAYADAKAALTLDPGSDVALVAVAEREADRGAAKAGIALLQERIDVGGKDRFGFIATKAGLQADAGDADGAIATLDAALTERPGDPDLLNGRCWIKATHKLKLDTALKDCTKAIELADHPAAALDSRAMVYFRLGRTEEALADLEAALDAVPDQPSSLFLRGIIRKAAGDAAGSASDLEGARIMSPRIDGEYKRWGITA